MQGKSFAGATDPGTQDRRQLTGLAFLDSRIQTTTAPRADYKQTPTRCSSPGLTQQFTPITLGRAGRGHTTRSCGSLTDRVARPPAQRHRDVDVGCSSTFVLRQDKIPKCRPNDSDFRRSSRQGPVSGR